MGMQVCMGASLQCSFGAAPSSLVVLPANKVMIGGMPALEQSSKLMCNWGGVIQVLVPGQFKVNDA